MIQQFPCLASWHNVQKYVNGCDELIPPKGYSRTCSNRKCVVALFRFLPFTLPFLTQKVKETTGYLKSSAVPAMTLLRHWYVDSVSQNYFKVFQNFKKTKFVSEVILTEGDLHMHLFSMLKFSIKNLLSIKNYF